MITKKVWLVHEARGMLKQNFFKSGKIIPDTEVQTSQSISIVRNILSKFMSRKTQAHGREHHQTLMSSTYKCHCTFSAFILLVL